MFYVYLYKIFYKYFKGLTVVRPLDYFPYNVSEAMSELKEKYESSADKFKSTIIDMYSLYRQIDPVEGKSFRKKLKNQLVVHIKDAGKGKWSSFKFDKEIKSILDSIEL